MYIITDTFTTLYDSSSIGTVQPKLPLFFTLECNTSHTVSNEKNDTVDIALRSLKNPTRTRVCLILLQV